MPVFRDDEEERAARLERLLERARATFRAAGSGTGRRRAAKKPAKATLDQAKRLDRRKKR